MNVFVKKQTAEQETDEQQVAVTLDGNALAAHAAELAAKEGQDMSDAIASVMKAKEDWQGGPFRVLIALQSSYTEEELDGFAVPDSQEGNNPDKFKITKTDANGKETSVNTTFYAQFGDATKEGSAILQRIEWTERAGKVNVIKDDIPREILDMNPNERETHLNFLNGRRNTIRQSYKKAMTLYFQFKAVSEYPGISCEPIWVRGKAPADVSEGRAENVEVENTTKPIAVWLTPDEGKPITKWEALSIGAFLKLNPNKAAEKGGGFTNLIESGVVKKDKAGTGSKSDEPAGLRIKTLDTGLSVAVELHRYLIDEVYGSKDKSEIGKLYKLINHKDADELVVTLVELRNALQEISKDCKLDDRYVKLQQSGSELPASKVA